MNGAPARRRGGQAALGAIDQAALAAAHFLLGVLVARLGGIASLGQFAFAYAVIVLANMAHAAVIAEFYCVDPDVPAGASIYGAWPLVLITAVLAGLAALAVAAGAAVVPALRPLAMSPAFLAALAASTCYWSVKPFFYRQARPGVVLASTLAYAAATLAAAWTGYALHGGAWQPLWAIALGAAAASLPLWAALRPPRRGVGAHLRRYVRGTLRYAAWALPAAVLIWVNGNGYLFAMPLLGDETQNGVLRAVLNLVAPINTLLVGACTAWLPQLAAAHRGRDPGAYQRSVHRAASILSAITLLGGALVALLSGPLLGLIYGAAYVGFAGTLRVAAALPGLWVAASVYRAAIRAQADARRLFRVYFFALVPLGLGLMTVLSPLGATAAVYGMLATQLVVVAGFIRAFSERQGAPA